MIKCPKEFETDALNTFCAMQILKLKILQSFEKTL